MLKFYRFYLDTFDIIIVITIIYGKIFLLINDLRGCRDEPSRQSDEKLRGHTISRTSKPNQPVPQWNESVLPK